MSQYDDVMNKKAVALRYDENKDVAPVIVASGLGYMAERIVEMANENGVPVYEDNSWRPFLRSLTWGRRSRRSCIRRSWISTRIF